MKTEQATTRYKRYDAAFKHAAVEHWMLNQIWLTDMFTFRLRGR